MIIRLPRRAAQPFTGILEIHQLVCLPPNNINRDDHGIPKVALFGGVRRGRISSQALRAQTRRAMMNLGLIPRSEYGQRTKRLVDAVCERLGDLNRKADAVTCAFATLGYSLERNKKTGEVKLGALLFIGPDELALLASAVRTHHAELLAYYDKVVKSAPKTTPAKRKPGRAGPDTSAVDAALEPAFPDLPKADSWKGFAKDHKVAHATLQQAIGKTKAPDVALFGRFVAHAPDKSIDGALYTGQALTIDATTAQNDFFSALDDRQAEDSSGSAHIDNQTFQSGVFYRYDAVDLATLHRNTCQDDQYTADLLASFVHATVTTLPSGKQRSFGAYAMPSTVLLVFKPHAQQTSLMNAFETPVTRNLKDNRNISEEGAALMLARYRREQQMYDMNAQAFLLDGTGAAIPAGVTALPNLDALILTALQAAVNPQ